MKKQTHTKSLKLGSFSVLITLAAAAVVVAVNIAVASLPTEWTHIDLSAADLLSISQETHTVLDSLTEDVTLYYLVQPGNEDMNTRELLDRYDDMSERVTVVRKDPLLYPGFAAQYTTDTLGENSVIVESARRFSVLTQDDIYVSYYTYDYDNYTYSTNTQFEGENAITSAIDFVTSETLPVTYVLSGHGEADLSASLVHEIERQNIEVRSLDLLSAGAVPENASCLVIAAPTQDISDGELEQLLTYMERGGNVLLITAAGSEAFPNLASLPGQYGGVLCPGLIREGSTDHSLSGYSHYLLPDLSEHEITSPMLSEGYRALLPITQGIQLTGSAPEGVSASPILSTTSSAYSKVDGMASTTLEREDKDISGPFLLGVSFTHTRSETAASTLVWYPCSMLLDEATNASAAGGNYTLLINSIGWMCEHKTAISIHGKSVMASYLTVPAAAGSRWSVFFIGVLPAILLLTAGLVWYRRKRA